MTLRKHVSNCNDDFGVWLSQYLHGIHSLGNIGPIETLNSKWPRDRPYPVEILPVKTPGQRIPLCRKGRGTTHHLVVDAIFSECTSFQSVARVGEEDEEKKEK